MTNGEMKITLKVPRSKIKDIHRGQIREIELKIGNVLKTWTVKVKSRYLRNGIAKLKLEILEDKNEY